MRTQQPGPPLTVAQCSAVESELDTWGGSTECRQQQRQQQTQPTCLRHVSLSAYNLSTVVGTSIRKCPAYSVPSPRPGGGSQALPRAPRITVCMSALGGAQGSGLKLVPRPQVDISLPQTTQQTQTGCRSQALPGASENPDGETEGSFFPKESTESTTQRPRLMSLDARSSAQCDSSV